MESTFNDIVQIGGREEVRPSPRRGVRVGNKSILARQSLPEMKEIIGMEARVLEINQLAEGNIPTGNNMRQTNFGGWYTIIPNNIETQNNNSPQPELGIPEIPYTQI